MNKRNFVRTITALVAAGASSASVTLALAARPAPFRARTTHQLIRPRHLKPGATVGLIAPGGVLTDAIIEKCVHNLESMGFRVKTGANIRKANGGYAGSAVERLDDLHAMFGDREVSAIWTARGGSGGAALLPGIDYAHVRRNAKILIGYSDVTALHLALYRHAGLVSFHGPVAWSTPTDYSVNQMQAVLMRPSPALTIHMSVENSRRAETQAQYTLRTMRHGVAEGRLMGGNLSVLSSLIGTPFAADLRDALLFLEEVGEAPYRIDRMLTQLQQSGALQEASGVMLGVFNRSKPTDDKPSLSLGDVINNHFAELGVPAVYGYSFGHISNQFTIPVGVRARLDTRSETLTLLEPAVIT